MGILSRSRSARWTDDPLARDPFDDAAAVKAMYDEGGILTHRRLRENIDVASEQEPQPPGPAQAAQQGAAGARRAGSGSTDFLYSPRWLLGGQGLPEVPDAPAGGQARRRRVTFTNLDALAGSPDNEQVWHSITSCQAPCNRGPGDRLPARQRPDQVRLRPARVRHRSQLRRDDRHQVLYDAAADQARARRTPTSAASTRSCAARSASPAAGPGAARAPVSPSARSPASSC